MKVLFIAKSLKMEPLGLMYLSAAAKAAGHKVELMTVDNKTSQEICDEVRQYYPDVIGYSVMTGDQEFYLELNKMLKKRIFKQFIAVFGGPHPTFFDNIIWEQDVDAICRGEGEEAFVEFLDKCEHYPKRSNTDVPNMYFNIPNLEWGNPGEPQMSKMIPNRMRPLAHIDSLKSPDRSLLKNHFDLLNCPIKHFIASRGCPYKCSYCFNEQYSKLYPEQKRVRFRDVDSLVDEIEETLCGYNQFVYFQDDTFTINKRWLQKFAGKYRDKVFVPFHCHVRANTIDIETVELLKYAGCRSVHIAIECANKDIRNNLLKRDMSDERIYNACQLLKDANIKFMTQNMIGLPTSTIDDDISTLEMNMQCKPDYAWVSIYQPYPGTWLGQWCIDNGWYKGDFKDIGADFFTGSRLEFPIEHKKQLAVLQKIFACVVYDQSLKYDRDRVKFMLKRGTPEQFEQSYKEERARGDEVLYGFKL